MTYEDIGLEILKDEELIKKYNLSCNIRNLNSNNDDLIFTLSQIIQTKENDRGSERTSTNQITRILNNHFGIN